MVPNYSKAPSLVLLLLGVLSLSSSVHGMSPNPEPYEIEQPDGSVIMAQMMGTEEDPHEECAAGEDCEGYTIIGAGPAGNEYQFAVLDETSGHLLPSGNLVKPGKAPPQGIGKHIRRTPGAAASMSFGGSSPLPDGLMGSSSNEEEAYEYVPNRRELHIDNYVNFTSATEDFHRQRSLLSWTGRKMNLVIPMVFKDHKSRWRPNQASINKLFNRLGGDPVLAPTGSIRDVFRTSSYNKLDLVSIVVDWIELPETEAYYANGDRGFTYKMHEAMQHALDYLENTKKFNFGQFDTDKDGLIDSICFLHSGYAAEWGGNSKDGANYMNRIWSHKWGLYGIRTYDGRVGWKSKTHNVQVLNYHISPASWGTGFQGDAIGRIGVIAHETGHFLGITDLYDTAGEKGSGLGSWGLMANSWGFDNTQKCPPIMSPWSKMDLGWVSPTVISTAGDYTVKPSYNSASQSIYKVAKNFNSASEYLLIEFRKPTGIESCMPNKGIAIWHIDDAASDYSTQGYPGQPGWPANGNHYRIALLQADGRYDLEQNRNRGDAGDLYTQGKSIGPGYNPATRKYEYPNTDSYQAGNVRETGITITVKSVTDAQAQFSISFGGEAEGDTEGDGGDGDAGDDTPTPAPVGCGWKKPFRLRMTTDNDGSDISWEISNGKNPSQVFHQGGNYPNNEATTHFHDLCLNPGFCYKFKVTDSKGNGFNSSDKDAGFVAMYDDKWIHSSPPGPFSQSLSDFGNCKIDGRQAKGFQVGFPADSKFFGNMFDIKATNNIVFSHIQSLHIGNRARNIVKIWTKNGSYKGFENAKEHWTLVSQQVVVGKGRGKRTDLKGFSQLVTVLKGSTQAFYVEINRRDLLFLNSKNRKWDEGDSWRKTADFDFLVGIHAGRNFGAYGGPSIFNGRLWYGPLLVSGSSGSEAAQGMVMDLESDMELVEQLDSGVYAVEEVEESPQDLAIVDELVSATAETELQAVDELDLHTNPSGAIGRQDNGGGFKGNHDGTKDDEDVEDEVDDETKEDEKEMDDGEEEDDTEDDTEIDTEEEEEEEEEEAEEDSNQDGGGGRKKGSGYWRGLKTKHLE